MSEHKKGENYPNHKKTKAPPVWAALANFSITA